MAHRRLDLRAASPSRARPSGTRPSCGDPPHPSRKSSKFASVWDRCHPKWWPSHACDWWNGSNLWSWQRAQPTVSPRKVEPTTSVVSPITGDLVPGRNGAHHVEPAQAPAFAIVSRTHVFHQQRACSRRCPHATCRHSSPGTSAGVGGRPVRSRQTRRSSSAKLVGLG